MSEEPTTDTGDETADEQSSTMETDGTTTIRPLDEDTVARIAAGEVVERPASAVKELVENSLDADATRIDVAVEDGGTSSIRVADDGVGMSEAGLRAAIRQHTTSKIDDVEDLESGVATLGFRGEALHTIGSVSRVTIRSRPRDGSETGTRLVYEGGDVLAVEPTGCPTGTIVEVTDLFFNTPARRKFLKTTATEFAHVNRVVTRYALANPDVAVSLTHDGREVFTTTGDGDLQATVLAVYGREVAEAMIAVDGDGDDLPAGPLSGVTGLVSHPETNRSSREYLATYVNGRAVRADAIRDGILAAYGAQLGTDRYPFVTLFLDSPADAVDVNVHPRKQTVRFDDGDAVRRQVEEAVRDALLEHGLVRSGAPRGRSAPAETRVEPESPSETERVASDAVGERDETEAVDERDETDAIDPGDRHDDPPRGETVAEWKPSSGSPEGIDSAANRSTFDGTGDESGTSDESDPETTNSVVNGRGESPDCHDRIATTARDPTDSRSIRPATEQRTLSGEEAIADVTFDSLPPLRVLGQLHETYVVCETPSGLALVDQHAADERVNYERLRRAFREDDTAQALARPVELELTAGEATAFEAYREALDHLGFRAERVGDRRVAVTTVPTVLEATLEPERLRDVLASFVAGDHDAGEETVEALAEALLGDLACHPSITGNTSLTDGSVLSLLTALDRCENPYACPHGRPVIVEFDEAEIEDRFERDYPGHGG